MFQTLNKELIDQVNYKRKSLNKLLVEIIMNEFPSICKDYIKNGMKKKIKVVKQFVSHLIKYQSTTTIRCDINNVCIANL